MNILVEPGTLHYMNVGDLAMLQVCIRRLRGLWPHARLLVFTNDPHGLAIHIPEAEPVLVDGRDLWFRHAPAEIKTRLNVGDDVLSHIGDTDEQPLIRDFIDVLRHTDLYVFSGMGGIASTFEAGVIIMLETILLAKSLGIPVAAFGQGVGPIDNPSPLWSVLATVGPLLDFIALREGKFGPSILKKVGVMTDRIVVTGDDTVELAFAAQRQSPGDAMGVNLRVCPYSGIGETKARRIGSALRKAVVRYQGPIIPAPISYVPWEADLDSFRLMFPELDHNLPVHLTSVEDTIRHIGKCRIVVTGSYHAAVFALSQGVPALCIAGSPYYANKFEGLADLFGDGCFVVHEGVDEETLIKAVNELWEKACDYRKRLLDAAARQVANGINAYSRLQRFSCAQERRWVRVHAVDDLMPLWSRRRISVLLNDLGEARRYLARVEEARDWHRDQAEWARAQLAETTKYLHEVEQARDWHRDRADRLEQRLADTSQ